MRLIFLNRFYWPDEPATAQLLGDLAEALAGAGHDVTVIASRAHPASRPDREVRHGVTILRTGTVRWARLGLPGKAVDFLSFYLSALAQLAFTVQRGDVVVALTDPPLIGLGAWLTARVCGARIFHWVQDIYPEIASLLTGQAWLQAVRPCRDLVWRRSDGCVTLGSDMGGTLLRAGVAPARLFISPNWAPAGLAPLPDGAADSLRAAWQLQGKFVVAYSGNLGRVHDLEPVLGVADALRGDARFAFVFIGAGAQRSRLAGLAAERGLANVQFRPPQPRAQLDVTLALGDVHLVTLLPGCESLVFPGKLYGVTAAGRPVIFIGPRGCEMARLVQAAGLGRSFGREDIAAIAATLRELGDDPALLRRMGTAAAAFGRAHAGPARAVADWEKLLTVAE